MKPRHYATLVAFTVSMLLAPQAHALCDSYISVLRMDTYDTGIRLLNGVWIIGSSVDMRSYNCFGNPTIADWNGAHFIVDEIFGGTIATTGSLHFSDSGFVSSLTGSTNFNSCYHSCPN